MELPTLYLQRIIDKKSFINANAILGKVFDNNNLVCVSIERPDLNNQINISCIPYGTYKCSKDKTGKYQYWKVEDVEGRENIEIHIANRSEELRGCIAFGKNWAIMKDNLSITNSKDILDNLLTKYPLGFYLNISDSTYEPLKSPFC